MAQADSRGTQLVGEDESYLDFKGSTLTDNREAQFGELPGGYVDETLIPGFYKKKYKFQVQSVNDFVSKVRKTAMCDKFFAQNDL